MPASHSVSRRAAWLMAARIPTLPAAVAPVLVGTAAAAGDGVFLLLPALAALAAAILIQIGTNLHNDAADFVRGADTAERRGPRRAAQSGLLTPRQVLAGAYSCLALAAACGLYLVFLRGWPLLLAGALSLAAAVGYTSGPWPLGYKGLGELFVFLFFGVVAVVGSDYVQTGAVRAVALAASVPVGALSTAILLLNNLRDIDTDRVAGKRTLAVRLGRGATRMQYLGCLAAAVVAPAAMRAAGLLGPLFWLPWITLPMMAGLARTVLREDQAPALIRALKRTALLLLVYGALLAAALLAGTHR